MDSTDREIVEAVERVAALAVERMCAKWFEQGRASAHMPNPYKAGSVAHREFARGAADAIAASQRAAQ